MQLLLANGRWSHGYLVAPDQLTDLQRNKYVTQVFRKCLQANTKGPAGTVQVSTDRAQHIMMHAAEEVHLTFADAFKLTEQAERVDSLETRCT